MACCKCNRSGSCRGCACVEAGKCCVNCLPSKLGTCRNPPNANNTRSPSLQPPVASPSPPPLPHDATVGSTRMSPPPTTSSDQEDSPDLARADQTSLSQVSAPITAHHDTVQQSLNFCWGEQSGQEVYDIISTCYEEVVHWILNLFLVPFGSVDLHSLRRSLDFSRRLQMTLVFNESA